MSTAFDKNLKVLLKAMLQPHKYRHSFPVHRNDPISALTLLPGLKKTCSPCRTRTARGAETDRPDLVEPPQLLATPGRHPSRPHPHHRKAPGAKPQATQPAMSGKKNTLRPNQTRGSADINTPAHFASGFPQTQPNEEETQRSQRRNMGIRGRSLKGRGYRDPRCRSNPPLAPKGASPLGER
jgi:hypothetical protein